MLCARAPLRLILSKQPRIAHRALTRASFSRVFL